jgi:tRNA pseudouridine55 synthase
MNSAFLVVDKPVGITSHDVVAMVRAVTGVPKVGHTGTLDPFATGVLPVALGGGTRLIQFLDEDLKVYDATIALGAATDTGDPTGQVSYEAPVPELSRERVEEVLASFRGPRMQVPPAHSAVKHKGRPLYAYAREGRPVQVEARPIRIDQIDLLDMGPAMLRVRIRCGRGTYARVLADEIAQALGTAGHLSALRRDQSGPFQLDRAVTLSQLAWMVADREDWPAVFRTGRGEDRVRWKPRDEVWAALLPFLWPAPSVLSHMPHLELRGPEELERVGDRPLPPELRGEGPLALICQGEVLAIGRRAGARLAVEKRLTGEEAEGRGERRRR